MSIHRWSYGQQYIEHTYTQYGEILYFIYIYIQHLQNQYYVIRIVIFNSVNSETHDVDQRVYSLIYYAEEKVCVLCVTYTSLFCLNWLIWNTMFSWVLYRRTQSNVRILPRSKGVVRNTVKSKVNWFKADT